MKLTPRLALAAGMCGKPRGFADIGCDHGYLAASIALGGCRRVFACDIRPGPLAKARETANLLGLEARIKPVLCGGLNGVSAHECDTVAICGMGGELIASILDAAPWTREGGHLLVLQPQSKSSQLRRFLAENGYTVEQERLAAEGDRLYCVLAARGGYPPRGAEAGYLFTEKMLGDPLFDDYLSRLLRAQKRALAGRQKGGLDASEIIEIIEILEKYKNAT